MSNKHDWVKCFKHGQSYPYGGQCVQCKAEQPVVVVSPGHLLISLHVALPLAEASPEDPERRELLHAKLLDKLAIFFDPDGECTPLEFRVEDISEIPEGEDPFNSLT